MVRRIKGLVRTVVTIAGVISLNSPLIIPVAASSEQRFISRLSGIDESSRQIGNPSHSVDHPVSLRGRIGKFTRKGEPVDSRRGLVGGSSDAVGVQHGEISGEA